GAATGSAAVVTVSINSVNDAPVAVGSTVSTDEDVPVGIVLQGTDVDGDLLTYHLTIQPEQGILSGSDANWTYRPKTSFHGSDSFSFNVSDGILTDTGTINISVSRVNNPPVLAAIQTQTTAEDVDHMITLSATDVDGDPLVFTAESAAPELVNPVLEGANLTLEVQEDKYGETRIGVTVQDGHGGIAETTFSLMVKAANDAPVAVDGAVSTDEDVPVGIILQGTDVDGDLLTYRLLPPSGPTHGMLSSLVGSQVTYRPDADYNGTDSFQFMASDGALDSVFGTVTVDILAVNDPPVADSQFGLTLASTDDKVEVVLTGGDVDGDPLVFEIVDSP
ncbi:TPA: tandem-95 repeat protein, partial [Candidatus Poribacteria bacterium]|nr:tandem-95 repeat protein [Candidatus Poribacteria bacterium]